MVALGCARKVAEAGGTIDEARVRRLTWLHDLNRWPFAHNSEQGLYDQAADLAAYFRDNHIPLDPGDADDLGGLHRKEHASLSREGSLVLGADQATGVIEDVLLGITAVGLAPEEVPVEIAASVGLPLRDPAFRQRLWEVRQLFRERGSAQQYGYALDRLVTAYGLALLDRHVLPGHDFALSEDFATTVRNVKSNFLYPVLFPITNDRVGHGPFLRARVIEPLIGHLGAEHARRLTALDDRAALELAVTCGFLRPEEVARGYPDLAYIEREEPVRAFRGM
jgi:hypothetical protein